MLLGGGLAALRGATYWRTVRRVRSLTAGNDAVRTFDPDDVEGLPAPARRYLRHAIDPDAPLARRADIDMQGSINLAGSWVPMSAREVIAARRGFVWRTRARLRPYLWVSGVDYYVDGTGGQRFFLAGLLPVVRASGPAVDASAAGRFVAELVWLPTALLPRPGVEWKAIDEDRAAVTVAAKPDDVTVTLSVAPDGSLLAVELDRVRPTDGDTETVPFGSTVGDERTFDGITVPTSVRAGWEFGTEDYEEFFTIDDMTVRYR